MAYGGSQIGAIQRKSQVRPAIFLVIFMLLVPTVLAIGYTGSITGDSVAMAEADTSPQVNAEPEFVVSAPETTEITEAYEPTEPADESAPETPDPPEPEPETEPNTQEQESISEEPQEPPEQPVEEPQEQPDEPAEETSEEPTEEPIEETPVEEIPEEPDEETPYETIGETIEEPDEETPEEQPDHNETEPEEQPEHNETEPETPGLPEITEPEINETDPEKSNETIPETNTTEPELPEPCNLTCGECEIIDDDACTCISDEDCQPQPPEEPGFCSVDLDCDDQNQCTYDTCINSTCQYQSIIPCCGNDYCEDGEMEACPEDCEDPEPPIIPGIPEEPSFSISVDSPARVTRGTTIEFSASIMNQGPGSAYNVNPYWILPEGFQLIATDHDCSLLLPDTLCTITGQIYIEPETIGRKEIRILVDYE